jgi:phage nucleotide-binding protein
MAITLKSTKDVAVEGVKILTHAPSGYGKTWLIRTLPTPFIISAESGLLSLSDCDIPYAEVSTIEDVQDVYLWAMQSEESKHFESIALDSISEIAEVVLSSEKSKSKDGRAAYGEMNDIMGQLIRSFRDIKGKNVYMSAKTEKVLDEKGRILYGPSMPGKSLTVQIPYWFDMVFALRVETADDGQKWRGLLCEGDDIWMAKNRGGRLEKWESPDLGAIIKKVSE